MSPSTDARSDVVVLGGAEIAELLPLDDCIAAVEQSFLDYAEGRVHAGVLSMHEAEGAFHVKAASSGRYFTSKTNANFPGNPQKHGLPTIQGVLLLFDATNGRVLAILDSLEVTSLRTAAATAVAAKYLARRDAQNVAIFGCGNQGRVHLAALKRVIDVARVRVYDTDRARALSLSSDVADDVASAAADADVIVTCTPSKRPFLNRDHVRRGTFVAAVGADNPEKSEIDPDLMAASSVVVDVLDQSAAMGDLHHAIDAGRMTREDVAAELGEIVAGRKRGLRANDGVVLFDSTGAGFQDTAAAVIAYERALSMNRGLRVRLGK